MIIEWIVKVATGLWAGISDLFPDWDLPPELSDPNGALGSIMAFGRGMEPFVNWTLIGVLAAIPPTLWLVGIAWRAIRMALSHIPFFGGQG